VIIDHAFEITLQDMDAFEVDIAVKDVVFPITKVDVGLSLQAIVFVGRETGLHTTHTVGSGFAVQEVSDPVEEVGRSCTRHDVPHSLGRQHLIDFVQVSFGLVKVIFFQEAFDCLVVPSEKIDEDLGLDDKTAPHWTFAFWTIRHFVDHLQCLGHVLRKPGFTKADDCHVGVSYVWTTSRG